MKETLYDKYPELYKEIYSAIASGLFNVEVTKDITPEINLATENVLRIIDQMAKESSN